ncbi:MAG: hypothetical protein M3O80_01355 [Chloroflexota bacterium]|nr:hypothetical protein [Chloroflexota bacterium]
MKKILKGLTLTAVIALSLLASTGNAYAKDAKSGRETAWTDGPALPDPLADPGNPIGIFGVTWEE